MKDVINLYTMDGCPRCKILKEKCEKSDYIKNSDFEIINVDVSNPKDTSLNLLLEHKLFEMPILLVNDNFLKFGEALDLLGEKDNDEVN